MSRIRTDPHGRTVLVTGAASGIGLALARLLAAEGARLVLTDVAAEGLERAVGELRASGADVAHHGALDVADRDAVEAFAADVHDQVGPVGVVANVAGISTWGRIEDLSADHWQRTVAVSSTCQVASSSWRHSCPVTVRAAAGPHRSRPATATAWATGGSALDPRRNSVRTRPARWSAMTSTTDSSSSAP